MNRYLLLAAAAASVAVTGPLPDLQWQSNNNRLFDFVAESPSALTQDVRGLNFLVLDKPWMIAGSPNVMPFTNDDQNYMDPENPHFNNIPDLPTLDNTSPEPPPTLSGTPTDTWILKSFECKAQASVCCSEENRLGPEFINSPSSTKSCAAKSDLWYGGSDLLEIGDQRIDNYCFKPDYVKGCDTLLNKMKLEPGLVCYSDCNFASKAQVLRNA